VHGLPASPAVAAADDDPLSAPRSRPLALASPLPRREDWPKGVRLALVHDLHEARGLLGPDGPEQRAARSALFWRARQIRARARLRLGMHDRGEDFLFGSADLCAADAAGHRRHLPLHLKTVHFDSLKLAAGETLDLCAKADEWPGLHFREELYLWVRIGRLEMGPGSRIAVRGNVCAMEFDTISFAGPPCPQSADWPEIAFLGTPHAPFSAVRGRDAEAGRQGERGADGRDGASVPVRPGVFGPRSASSGTAADGGAGEAGGDGGAGGDGRNGGMLMLADLRIGALAGFGRAKLRVLGKPGDGAPGAPGGQGGAGGRGGRGGDGFAGVADAGRGGPGGSGGHGGSGGRGGQGGLGSNIFVSAPAEDFGRLELVALPGAGGAGGPGGAGGLGGAGGEGGRRHGGVDAAPAAAAGREGDAGAAGAAGAHGRSREPPPIHFIPLTESKPFNPE